MHTLYQGPSQIDGEPIVCLLTGLDRPSGNEKTGPMLQTWIIRSDIPPMEAVKTGKDASICGSCPHRATSCYVLPFQGPSAVYKTFKDGFSLTDNLKKLGRNQRIRVSAYGDPAAVPIEIWEDLLLYADGWTGYTHSPIIAPVLKKYLMASADTEDQAKLYQNLGWKTFRVKTAEQSQLPNEVKCPYVKNGTLKCITCMKCNGQQSNIVVDIHGAQFKIKHFTDRYSNDQAHQLELLEPTSL